MTVFLLLIGLQRMDGFFEALNNDDRTRRGTGNWKKLVVVEHSVVMTPLRLLCSACLVIAFGVWFDAAVHHPFSFTTQPKPNDVFSFFHKIPGPHRIEKLVATSKHFKNCAVWK